MPFMTQGTLANMPAYLADDRSRRAERIAEEERKKQELMKQRMMKFGQEFLKHGDYTAQGIKTFAEKNEMSMPEMKGLIDMVTNYKKLEKERQASLIDTRPAGANYTQRTEDAPGVRNYDKPPAPNLTPVRGPGQNFTTLQPSAPGVKNYDKPPAPGAGTSDKVSDGVKFTEKLVKTAIGLDGDMNTWTPEASKKYQVVLAKAVDRLQKGDNPTDAVKITMEEIGSYDTNKDAMEAVAKLPESSFTMVSTAKTAAKKALDAGADPEIVRQTLKEKGWSDSDIEKAMSSSSASTAKSTTVKGANPLGL